MCYHHRRSTSVLFCSHLTAFLLSALAPLQAWSVLVTSTKFMAALIHKHGWVVVLCELCALQCVLIWYVVQRKSSWRWKDLCACQPKCCVLQPGRLRVVKGRKHGTVTRCAFTSVLLTCTVRPRLWSRLYPCCSVNGSTSDHQLLDIVSCPIMSRSLLSLGPQPILVTRQIVHKWMKMYLTV